MSTYPPESGTAADALGVHIDPASLPADSDPGRRAPRDATVHACPPEGSGLMPCCGRAPFEVPGDRMTIDPGAVTCGQPASGWDPDIANVDGRIVVTWPRGRVPVVVWPEVIEGWADSVNSERAEVERLRGLLAEALAPGLLADRWVEIRREAGLA